MSPIQSNIPKLYVLVSLRWLLFIIPIIVLFYYENGLDQTQVMILQSIFSIAIVLFEIPSGYFSDVIGRRTTIILGSIFSFLGFVIYSLSYGFWGFLAGELTMGLGASFISGTDSAMLYDSLIELGREDDYGKLEGVRTSICNFSETVASIIGGFLATVSLRTPFYVETAVIALTIPLAFTLQEPERHKLDGTQGPWKSILKIVRFAIQEHAEIKWLIVYSAIIGSSTLTMVWFIQPYMQAVGLPLAYFGIVWAALNFSVGIFSMYAYKIERRFGRKKTLMALVPLSFIGYLLTALFQTVWAILFIFIFYFVRGIQGPVLKDYINRLTTSEKRATVLSVKNMMGRLLFSIIGPFLGWYNDVYSMQAAFLLGGSFFLVSGVVSLIFLRKHKAL